MISETHLFLFAISIPVIMVASIVWAYRDAERRGKEGLLAALFVALAIWPLSLIIWLIVRPAHVEPETNG